MTEKKLFPRLVTGEKGFRYKNPNTGVREVAKKGVVVHVSAKACQAFKHILKDPEVAKREADAAKAAADAAAEEAAANQRPQTPAPKPQVQNQNQNPGPQLNQGANANANANK